MSNFVIHMKSFLSKTAIPLHWRGQLLILFQNRLLKLVACFKMFIL